jgi:hypothetical protein
MESNRQPPDTDRKTLQYSLGWRLDGGVFLANMAIELMLLSLNWSCERLPLRGPAWWGFFALCAGTFLKRDPLGSRWNMDRLSPAGRCLAGIMLLALYPQSLLLLMHGYEKFTPLLAVVAVVPIILTVGALLPQPVETSRRLVREERIADMLLGVAAIVMLQIFRQEILPDLEWRAWVPLAGRIAGTAFIFCLFYLPVRLLFLVEDWERPLTWLRALVVVTPLLVYTAKAAGPD